MSKYLIFGLFVLSFQFFVSTTSATVDASVRTRELTKITTRACELKTKNLTGLRQKLANLNTTLNRASLKATDKTLVEKAKTDLATAKSAVEVASAYVCSPKAIEKTEIKAKLTGLEEALRTAQAAVKQASLAVVDVVNNGKK